MIREVAELSIDPADEELFLAAVEKAVPIFSAAEGCRAMRLERIVETPGVFRLVVSWDTLAHHTGVFRNSQGFADWRALVGGFFTAPPKVDLLIFTQN